MGNGASGTNSSSGGGGAAGGGGGARKSSSSSGIGRKKSSSSAPQSKSSKPSLSLGGLGATSTTTTTNTTAPSGNIPPPPRTAPPPAPSTAQPQSSATKQYGPANPKLEALQTTKQVMKQIQEIETHNPRQTVVGHAVVEVKTGDTPPFQLEYAFVSQTGYYPEQLNKPNQDKVAVHAPFTPPVPPAAPPPTTNTMCFFGVFDGHGTHGDSCAEFARDHVPINFASTDAYKHGDFERAFHDSYVSTNADMHLQERYGKFTDMLSGTTAICGMVAGRTLYVANVGDSRAILCVRDESGKLRAEPLSIDQTPFREDER